MEYKLQSPAVGNMKQTFHQGAAFYSNSHSFIDL